MKIIKVPGKVGFCLKHSGYGNCPLFLASVKSKINYLRFTQTAIMVPKVPARNGTLRPAIQESLIKGAFVKVQIGTGETNERWCSVPGCQQLRASPTRGGETVTQIQRE